MASSVRLQERIADSEWRIGDCGSNDRGIEGPRIQGADTTVLVVVVFNDDFK